MNAAFEDEYMYGTTTTSPYGCMTSVIPGSLHGNRFGFLLCHIFTQPSMTKQPIPLG